MDQQETLAAISSAIFNGDVEEVRRLLRADAALIHTLHGDQPWVCRAAGFGHLPLVKLLIELGCHVNAESLDRHTALDKAIMLGNLPMTELLLQHGANPNQGRQI